MADDPNNNRGDAYDGRIKELRSVEVVDQSQISVMAKQGANIFDVGRECIVLANLLKVAVKLYFNDKQIDIYVDTTIEQIINKA